jgi:hypothetical protein
VYIKVTPYQGENPHMLVTSFQAQKRLSLLTNNPDWFFGQNREDTSEGVTSYTQNIALSKNNIYKLPFAGTLIREDARSRTYSGRELVFYQQDQFVYPQDFEMLDPQNNAQLSMALAINTKRISQALHCRVTSKKEPGSHQESTRGFANFKVPPPGFTTYNESLRKEKDFVSLHEDQVADLREQFRQDPGSLCYAEKEWFGLNSEVSNSVSTQDSTQKVIHDQSNQSEYPPPSVSANFDEEAALALLASLTENGNAFVPMEGGSGSDTVSDSSSEPSPLPEPEPTMDERSPDTILADWKSDQQAIDEIASTQEIAKEIGEQEDRLNTLIQVTEQELLRTGRLLQQQRQFQQDQNWQTIWSAVIPNATPAKAPNPMPTIGELLVQNTVSGAQTAHLIALSREAGELPGSFYWSPQAVRERKKAAAQATAERLRKEKQRLEQQEILRAKKRQADQILTQHLAKRRIILTPTKSIALGNPPSLLDSLRPKREAGSGFGHFISRERIDLHGNSTVYTIPQPNPRGPQLN